MKRSSLVNQFNLNQHFLKISSSVNQFNLNQHFLKISSSVNHHVNNSWLHLLLFNFIFFRFSFKISSISFFFFSFFDRFQFRFWLVRYVVVSLPMFCRTQQIFQSSFFELAAFTLIQFNFERNSETGKQNTEVFVHQFWQLNAQFKFLKIYIIFF